MGFVENFGPKVNVYSVIVEHKNFFALEDKTILCPFTSVSYILTVTNNQVCSNMRPLTCLLIVERFRAS